MLFGIPDATLAAIITILSGVLGWAIKEWRDKTEQKNQLNSKVNVRYSDEYDFAGRLKKEIIRLRSMLDGKYKDSQDINNEVDALQAENLKLIDESYNLRREVLKLKYETTKLSDQIDEIKGEKGL